MPIESYDPRLLEAWRRAPLEPVRIPVRSRAQAVTLRHRLYRLRAELRRMDHPLIHLADRAKISIIPHSRDHFEVVIARCDDEYDEALKAANLDLPRAEKDPLEEILGDLPPLKTGR